MNDDVRPWVELGALQLAGIVVAAHLYWGLDRLAGQLRHGVYVDPRPITFVLSSGLIIAGVVYAAVGGRREPVYALGIALMLAYIFGYWGWHLVGHVTAMPWVEGEPASHPDWGPVETLVRHLETDAIALVSKLAELALAIVLGVLWLDEHREGPADTASPADQPTEEPSGPPDRS